MMNSTNASSNSDSGISLATVTAGIVAAVMFLLVSSFVSNEANWPMTSERVWATKTLTGDEIARNKGMMPSELQSVITSNAEQQDKEGHFLDALYRAEFMSIFTEPT